MTGLPAAIAAAGGEFAATIATARECAWTVESDVAWLQITPRTGQGETVVAIVVAQNPSGAARTASVEVNGALTSVRQDAAPCEFAWKVSSVDVPAGGGRVTIDLSATPACPWQASSNAGWLRGTRTSGTGDGSAEFVADANPDAERTAGVRVGDASVTVTQGAAEESTPAPSPSPAPGPAPVPVPTPIPEPPPPPPLIATYVGTASGAHNFDVSGPLSLEPGKYTITFSRVGTIYVRGVAGGGGGGGGKRRDDGGSNTGGGGGGGGGAASVSGQAVDVVPDVAYEAVVGSGGAGGAAATEASGNIAGNGSAGTQTSFRIQNGSVYLQLAGGSGGSGGTITSGPGGAGGTVAVGSGIAGGAGGNGGSFFGGPPQPGIGTSGVSTGGGGGGGHSNEQSSPVGGAAGAAGGASGGAGGNGGAGGLAGSGATDSGAGGEGARDTNGGDSPGGGGGGGKGVSIAGGPFNRGGGGGGGGAINTANSTDRSGGGGAGGNGGMSIGLR